MLTDHLQRLVAASDIDIEITQQQQLVKLVELLHKWNRAYNLTSVRDPEEMLIKHIMDSVVVSPFLEGKRFIDVGTGPGLPGLPLAIINPDKEFVLLDSLGKRIRFIKQVIFELKLDNVTTVQSRVEEFQPETGFDGVISRAFASLDDMLQWCKHLPAMDGRFYALKGTVPEAELANLPAHLALDTVHPLRVPELDGERHLVLIKRIKE